MNNSFSKKKKKRRRKLKNLLNSKQCMNIQVSDVGSGEPLILYVSDINLLAISECTSIIFMFMCQTGLLLYLVL
jgi:hypothetical protein